MARWIYCFTEGEARELAAHERQDLRRRYVRTRWGALGIGVLAALCFIPFVIGIAFAVDRPVIGWPILIVSVILGVWIFSKVGDRDKLALLYRRAARVGRAREWHRSEAPSAVRQTWGVIGPSIRHRLEADEDDEIAEEGPSNYWELEERFDRRLEWAAGRPVDQFETIDGDGVILTLEGKLARRVIHAYIVGIGVDARPPTGV